ncbi:MAG: segregation/condensation protein A [Saprospiraceae bacterium]
MPHFFYLRAPMSTQEKGYTIKIDQFEGPFDLLLFFIERDELDIHDIPIAKITEDFLDYIRQVESLNLDLASEFILVAASLIRIKAKMLIPRKELDENNQEIDPRRELVQKLLEYKAIKEVINELSDKEDDQSFRIPRGNLQKEFELLSQKALVDAEWETLNLFNLLKVFQRVTEKFEKPKKETIHHIFDYKYEIADQQTIILSKFKTNKKLDFVSIFESCENRIHAIVTFLALLDLINIQQIRLTQGSEMNSFMLEEFEENSSNETK